MSGLQEIKAAQKTAAIDANYERAIRWCESLEKRVCDVIRRVGDLESIIGTPRMGDRANRDMPGVFGDQRRLS